MDYRLIRSIFPGKNKEISQSETASVCLRLDLKSWQWAMALMLSSQSYLVLNYFSSELYKIIVRLFQDPALKLSRLKIKALYQPYV